MLIIAMSFICMDICAGFSFWPNRFLNTCPSLLKEPAFPLLHQAGECGEVAFSQRIMGGQNTTLGELPFMALLLIRDLSFEDKFCGGSVINKRYILTAAHCTAYAIEQIDNEYVHLIVRLGENDMKSNPDCDDYGSCAPPVQDFYVEQIIPHENYDNVTLNNDIALLSLNRDIVFNNYISPVCLPFDCKLLSDSFEGEKVLLAGWGNLEDDIEERQNRVPGRFLQKVQLKVTSQNGCEADYGETIPETKMCAGGRSEYMNGKDACKGDSGGPLLYTSSLDGYSYSHFQIGVVSKGEKCTKDNKYLFPGIYMRVTSYIPWILQHVRP